MSISLQKLSGSKRTFVICCGVVVLLTFALYINQRETITRIYTSTSKQRYVTEDLIGQPGQRDNRRTLHHTNERDANARVKSAVEKGLLNSVPNSSLSSPPKTICPQTPPLDDTILALTVIGSPIKFLSNYKNPCWKELEPKRGQKLHCLPYFYLAGQPKCGTTDLYYELIKHPDIAPCSIKEPHWWARKRVGKAVEKPRPFWSYLEYFENAANNIDLKKRDGYHHMITGEASASTLWDMDTWTDSVLAANLTAPKYLTAHYIHALTPKAKIIIILRNPAERLHSDALYFKTVDNSPKQLHEIVVNGIKVMKDCIKKMGVRSCVYNTPVARKVKARLRIGMYYTYIKDWLKVFPRDQFFITRLEDYSVDRLAVLNKIYRFLGLPPIKMSPTRVQDDGFRNRGRDHDNATMYKSTRRLLDNFYQPYNRKLAALLNDDRFLWES